ncbi:MULTISPECIES: PfkB family carbohydrate kinase [Halolamina]|uniref:Ribokinase n=1 Tax=Halolamina pelagica TaxID=699431 RepID=A0A1I5PLN3_9EURY|nr:MULTISPECIES: PfkB family carbohydrate kinase [Halolamina]NHX34868.1 sugar kinase [Halolamina sp. R1-12]SFP34807.1 ribokinase [Halolamina pelagica]
MSRIVSLGSINVDRVENVTAAELDEFEARYDWFPERGETVEVSGVPAAFPEEADTVFHGGKGANQAAAAASAGGDTRMLGKVGTDHREFDVRGRLAEPGVDTTAVETDGSVPTGTAYVFVDDDGENRIVVRPGANDAIDWTYVRDHYGTIVDADCLLIQNEIPTAPVSRLLSELSTEPDRPTVVLDPAPAEGAAALLDDDAVDYVTPNESEYAALESELDAFDGVVVRKRGGDDVIVDAEREFTVSPPTVPVTDTTGAGDVLNGFLGARLAAGDPLPEAVGVATVAASLATRERGARNGVPTLARVREFADANVHKV